MDEYIKREDARRAIEHADPAFCYVLDHVPTADVEKVRHGEWEGNGDFFLCSACSNYAGYEYDYCPYCGAKMDGKQEE